MLIHPATLAALSVDLVDCFVLLTVLAVFFFFLLAFGSVHSPVMDEVEEFIQGPVAEVLDRCTKDQLIKHCGALSNRRK